MLDGGRREAGAKSQAPAEETGAALAGHWSWRPDWTAEHRVWWWYATFEHDAAVHRLATAARRSLRPDAPVDLVPTRWLHLTLAEVGHASAVPRPLAYEAARSASDRVAGLAPLKVRVGPVITMSGAIVLRVQSLGLQDVHDALVASLPDDLPCRPVQRSFDPHVTIAYVARDCRRSDVLEPDDPARALTDVSVETTLDHLTLAEVVRDRGHYRWTPRCRVSLDGHAQPAPSVSRAPRRPRHLRSVD
jgi:2'-5' RNA ligase